jgi:hypothetical protein
MGYTIPEGAVELDNRVYRRKPWKGNRRCSALVQVGTLELVAGPDGKPVAGPDGKPTGEREFVPLRSIGTTDPLKASKARARAKKPKAEAPKPEAKRKPESSKPSPAPGRR